MATSQQRELMVQVEELGVLRLSTDLAPPRIYPPTNYLQTQKRSPL